MLPIKTLSTNSEAIFASCLISLSNIPTTTKSTFLSDPPAFSSDILLFQLI